ncbi:MAG: DnaD domain protein [Bacilli bacterium]|nr:DnaD domain protein [Bacilli bacterium]
MKLVTLLPADKYLIINKTILSDQDRETLINLYEPIIGATAVGLYLAFWNDLNSISLKSKDHSHHHLMTLLKLSLEDIKKAREALEAMGLVKTYYKEGDINEYIYELYSPLLPSDFFNNAIYNVVLYNNIGKGEYDNLVKKYQKIDIDLTGYDDITKKINEVYQSVDAPIPENIIKREFLGINSENIIDFDFIVSSLPKGLVNQRTFTLEIRKLINQLSYIYNFDNIKMCELIRESISEKGIININDLRKNARSRYQSQNGALPSLIYRIQPEYLKSPQGDNSKRGKLIAVFENTTPYDFLKSKYNNSKPTARDLKLLESLLIDLDLKPAVVNVLIDYVLKKNNNKLTTGFVETIAGQWKRQNIETAADAMAFAEEEHRKSKKISEKKIISTKKQPEWFDEKIEKKEITEEEEKKMQEMMEKYR